MNPTVTVFDRRSDIEASKSIGSEIERSAMAGYVSTLKAMRWVRIIP